jgi:hypothetical protein
MASDSEYDNSYDPNNDSDEDIKELMQKKKQRDELEGKKPVKKPIKKEIIKEDKDTKDDDNENNNNHPTTEPVKITFESCINGKVYNQCYDSREDEYKKQLQQLSTEIKNEPPPKEYEPKPIINRLSKKIIKCDIDSDSDDETKPVIEEPKPIEQPKPVEEPKPVIEDININSNFIKSKDTKTTNKLVSVNKNIYGDSNAKIEMDKLREELEQLKKKHNDVVIKYNTTKKELKQSKEEASKYKEFYDKYNTDNDNNKLRRFINDNYQLTTNRNDKVKCDTMYNKFIEIDSSMSIKAFIKTLATMNINKCQKNGINHFYCIKMKVEEGLEGGEGLEG